MICAYCLGMFLRPTYPPEYEPDYCSAQCARLDQEERDQERLPAKAVTSPRPRPAGMNVYDIAFGEGPSHLTADGVLIGPEATLTLRKDPK